MKITSNYKSKKEMGDRLIGGDIVFMRGSQGAGSFYGIYCNGVGVIELENGSDAYASTKESLFVGSKISYWTVEKVFKNCELIINE